MWFDSGCKPTPRARWADDGQRIEIEDEGFPTTPLPGAVLQWSAEIRVGAARTGIPAPFIAGLIAAESGGNPKAGSPAGAQGLMQLMPATAAHVAGRPVSMAELHDPALNIELGSAYLKTQLDRYGGNPIKATAAYNAGGAYCTGNCLNRWGLRADCDPKQPGAGVDYTTRVIRYTNAAADSFPAEASTGRQLWWGVLGVSLGAAAVVAFTKYRRDRARGSR